MAQSYIINKFYGGMAGDDYLGSEGSFMYSENIDIRQNYDSIETIRHLKEMGNTGTSKMTGIFESKEGKRFCYGEDGKFYNMSGVYLGATTSTRDVLNAVEFGDYIYFPYKSGTVINIDRITVDDANAGVSLENGFNGRITNNAITITTNKTGAYQYPVLNYVDEILFIGAGRRLLKIKIGESTADTVFTEGLEDDIVGLSESSGLFKIFLKNGKILFWDGQSEVFQAITELKNTIRTVYSIGATDYIIAGYNKYFSELHILQGYEAQLLQRVIRSETLYKRLYDFEGDHQSMCKRLGLLWLAGGDSNIYTYGTDVLGTPEAFQLSYNKYVEKDSTATHDIDSVFSLFPTSNGIYTLFDNELGEHKIGFIDQFVDNSSNQSEGYLISRKYDAGSKTQTKQLQKVKVKVSSIGGGSNVTISINKNGKKEFSELKFEQVGICNDPTEDLYEFSLPLGEFNSIIVRADITGSAKLEEVNIIYDIINE